MTLELQCEQFPLTHEQIMKLLDCACDKLDMHDSGHVTLRCVEVDEITNMNATYRHKNSPTNILTFSYDENEHDIAICMNVAADEARDRGVELADYAALLVTHGFLHALGMDHEASEKEELKTEELEKQILAETGFAPVTLFAV